MVEENFTVEFNMPLEKRQKIQDQYNKTLLQFKNFLQTNYGTSNVQAATAIATTILTIQIAINIATLGIGIGKLLGPQPSTILNVLGAGLPIEKLPLSEKTTLTAWLLPAQPLWSREDIEGFLDWEIYVRTLMEEKPWIVERPLEEAIKIAIETSGAK